ncbi:hypothetical protein [Patulibacter defluvii]|uniref:hypothetical protein n=1 Tax=Patulibacter defluvii TaxID=3095358 RepID=UPI002A75032F|nr:hypothetical protein [Patulibacter sp. DM4]
MRHDPIDVPTDGALAPRTAARRTRRPATRRPHPVDLGIAVAASEDQGAQLAAEVLDPGRRQPIVCLSTRAGEDRPALDVRRVREAVGRGVLLRAVRTGPASRALSACLPPQLGVFGGAARVWWPGVDERADPRAHPLVLDRAGRYGRRAVEVLSDRVEEGPPAPPAPRAAGPHLVALPGGEDRPAPAPPARPAAPAPAPAATAPEPGADRDRQLLLGALEAAREEIHLLRRKLAEARVDQADGVGGPRPAAPEQLARLAIPAAVVRDGERAHHLEIVAAWLARDHDAGRRQRPLGPLALGPGYVEAVAAHRDQVSPAALAAIAARIASGKRGEADDLDVRPELAPDGSPEHRREDGAAAWSCAIDAGGRLRLRWWTRDDGAVELRDLTT